MGVDECAMCQALYRRTDGSESRIYNHHLLEFENFVVIPALGPLVVGHVMVVTRVHTPNLLSCSKDQRAEYEKIIGIIRSIPFYEGCNILEAEHGSLGSNPGGACIDHAHVNIIPDRGVHINMFNGELPILKSGSNFLDLEAQQKPYILLKNESNYSLYNGVNVPSQLIRRRLCKLEGREDWDWGVFQQIEDVRATIAIYQEALRVGNVRS